VYIWIVVGDLLGECRSGDSCNKEEPIDRYEAGRVAEIGELLMTPGRPGEAGGIEEAASRAITQGKQPRSRSSVNSGWPLAGEAAWRRRQGPLVRLARASVQP